MFPSTRLAQQTALQELKTSSAGYSNVNQRKEVHGSLATVWEEWTEQFGHPDRPGSTGLKCLSMLWSSKPGAPYDIKARSRAPANALTRFSAIQYTAQHYGRARLAPILCLSGARWVGRVVERHARGVLLAPCTQ